jgi:hypothetical protein
VTRWGILVIYSSSVLINERYLIICVDLTFQGEIPILVSLRPSEMPFRIFGKIGRSGATLELAGYVELLLPFT